VNAWHYIVLVIDLWILLALVPWILSQLLGSRWTSVERQDQARERAQRLRDVAGSERVYWPATVRAGLYGEADRRAMAQLEAYDEAASEASRILNTLPGLRSGALRPLDLAKMAGWPRLANQITVWRRLRAGGGALDQAQGALDDLLEARREVETIPANTRARLGTLRSETMRLLALVEAEVERGTIGLSEIERYLHELEERLDQALADLSIAPGDDPMTEVARATELADLLEPRVEALDERVQTTIGGRERAEGRLEASKTGLEHLDERWAALERLGVTEAGLGRALARLRIDLVQAQELFGPRTLGAYEAVLEACEAIDGRIEALNANMTQLASLQEEARAALEGDLAHLSTSQESVESLASEGLGLDPDVSRRMIEEASELYLQAETQRELGTIEGYQAAIAMAQEARTLLAEAEERLLALPNQLRAVRDELANLDGEVLDDWRHRASRLTDELAAYQVHWNGGLSERANDALGALDDVALMLERIPPRAREQGRFLQSELDDLAGVLDGASQAMAQAQALVGELESDLLRLEEQRALVDERVAKLNSSIWAELEGFSGRMLPGLRERYRALSQEYRDKLSTLSDPAQVNYDHCVNIWLPDIETASADIKLAHERDTSHYQRMVRERAAQVEKKWARLVRLDPLDPPLPEENVERLERDVERWLTDLEKQQGNLPVQREALGKRADDLERRIEGAIRQVDEGRAELRALEKRFDRHAQAVRSARGRLRDLERTSAWPNIDWELDDIEARWEQATLERHAARTSPSLQDARQRMTQAIASSETADDAFQEALRGMHGDLQVLSGDLRQATQALDRALGEVELLEEQGEADDAETLRLACNRAQERLDAAQEARTPEDVSRALRDVNELLNG